MPDLIRLLPDAIANQIAAGEVVQRPASVVKELMENAIDAGSSQIHLIIKDSGKTLIQVIDDGIGMSAFDARMCFERHATSKITASEDLFKIKTKGFRGEALASIAAIAQVELKTRREEDELGTEVLIEGSEIKSQEECSCAKGTSFSVRNIFYNTPARRNFLKSDSVETRHIIDEFQRVALAHPGIAFRMHHNNAEVFNLPKGPLRQRIIGVLGNKYNQRLVPVDVETDIVKVFGFVGKPEFSRKTRGEQFFFVNDRFIKSTFFHHAVMGAYEQLLAKDSYPLYFLFLEVDPSQIDVNIHPTKTEVKFQDERSIYAILNSGVKQALGKYHIVPTIDFDQEMAIQIEPLPEGKNVEPPEVRVNPEYNPFESKAGASSRSGSSYSGGGGQRIKAPSNWEDLYSLTKKFDSEPATVGQSEVLIPDEDLVEEEQRVLFQLGMKYMVTRLKSGLVVIHLQRAMERIHYERYMHALQDQSGNSQQLLFPENVTVSASDAELITEILPELKNLGLDVDPFGPREFIIRGIPSESVSENGAILFERFIEEYKNFNSSAKHSLQEKLAKSMARGSGRLPERRFKERELRDLSDQLFACENPQYDPSGRAVIVTFTGEELDQKFE